MSCPVCGHNHVFLHYTIGPYSLKCGRKCGHAVTDPIPDPAESAALYDEKYFATHCEDVAPGNPGLAKHMGKEDHRVHFVKKYKTEGRLLDVPNHDSIDTFMEGEHWPGWDLPFHCHHFTSVSLELLVRRHGFEILGRKTYHCGYIKNRLAENPITRLFSRPIAKLFPGSSILFACRKKAH